jgi:peptidylprolyl isomerase
MWWIVPAAVVLAAGCGSSSKPSSSSTPTSAGGSGASAPCVGLKDSIPAPFTSIPIPAGPAPTTLVVKDLKVGSGPVVPAGATITADYVGVACSTGKVFDSSKVEGGAQRFPLSGVIAGWTQGIPGMHVGGQRLLGIPAALAYGAAGAGPQIGPNEALWFVVQPNKLG